MNKSKALEMENGKEKRQKVQNIMSRRSLFEKLPDEMVLTILSYGDMKDIQMTHGLQSKNVQHCTETTSSVEAAKYDNLDNLKWIYGYIGHIEFESYSEEDDHDDDGNLIPSSCTGN